MHGDLRIHHGWFKTKDIVEVEDGKLRFLRRADRKTKILGELIDLDELEQRVNGKGDQQVVLIAQVDERRGSQLLPVVEHEPSEQLKDWLATFSGLERLSRPVIRAFPRSALGKVMRGKIF